MLERFAAMAVRKLEGTCIWFSLSMLRHFICSTNAMRYNQDNQLQHISSSVLKSRVFELCAIRKRQRHRLDWTNKFVPVFIGGHTQKPRALLANENRNRAEKKTFSTKSDTHKNNLNFYKTLHDFLCSSRFRDIVFHPITSHINNAVAVFSIAAQIYIFGCKLMANTHCMIKWKYK